MLSVQKQQVRMELIKEKRTGKKSNTLLRIHNIVYSIRLNLYVWYICRYVHSIAVNRNLCAINKNRFTDWQKMHLTFCDTHTLRDRNTHEHMKHTNTLTAEAAPLFYLFANNKRRVNYFLWLGCANNHKASKEIGHRKKHTSSLNRPDIYTKGDWTRQFVRGA